MSVVLSGAWIAQYLGIGLFALCLVGVAALLVGRLSRASRSGNARAWGNQLDLAPLPIRWLDAVTRRRLMPLAIIAPTAPRAPPAERPGYDQPPPGFTASRRRVAMPTDRPDPR